MTLEYFNGDYVRENSGISSLASGTNKNYYNGTIVAQSWRSQKPEAVSTSTTYGSAVNNPAMFTYEYDDKYQFNNNKYGTPDFGSNSFTESLNKNREYGLTYDDNGNIKTLNRTDKNGTVLNTFNYTYLQNTNKLSSVSDYSNYTYDDLGQMISKSDGTNGLYLTYDVSGKVTAIYSDEDKSSAQLKVSFIYDESGNRIKKTDHIQNITTYYVYDASGNVLSIYDNNGNSLQQKEIPVYASGRIATFNKIAGTYQYELTDHLGNVLAVITDKRTLNGSGTYEADVVSAQDYYAFGMAQPGRTYDSDRYRYGFNGKENDNEVKGTGNQQDYGMRIYDPRLGRFLSVDPLANVYPELTPYQFASNTPIWAVDIDGLEWDSYLQRLLASGRSALRNYVREKVTNAFTSATSSLVNYFKDEVEVSYYAKVEVKYTLGGRAALEYGKKSGGFDINLGSVELVSFTGEVDLETQKFSGTINYLNKKGKIIFSQGASGSISDAVGPVLVGAGAGGGVETTIVNGQPVQKKSTASTGLGIGPVNITASGEQENNSEGTDKAAASVAAGIGRA